MSWWDAFIFGLGVKAGTMVMEFIVVIAIVLGIAGCAYIAWRLKRGRRIAQLRRESKRLNK